MRKAENKPFSLRLDHGQCYCFMDLREAQRMSGCLAAFGEKGYTSLAPQYRGHGTAPEKLITTNPDEWWQDVQEAYQRLHEAGYQEIAVAGLSLGGVFH